MKKMKAPDLHELFETALSKARSDYNDRDGFTMEEDGDIVYITPVMHVRDLNSGLAGGVRLEVTYSKYEFYVSDPDDPIMYFVLEDEMFILNAFLNCAANGVSCRFETHQRDKFEIRSLEPNEYLAIGEEYCMYDFFTAIDPSGQRDVVDFNFEIDD